MARWRVGLAEDELHPAGYRIRRIRVSARNGLPGANLAQPALRWWRERRGSKPAAARSPAVTSPAASRAAPPSDEPTAVGPAPGGLVGRIRRAKNGAVRLASIGLVIRSQIRNTSAAPEARLGDLYHGMAYMGIPVALDLGKRNGAPVVYDARDIYVDAANLARLPGPARALVGRWERGWARRAARVVTVNRPYAEVMAARWKVPMPLIVLNCSYRQQRPASPSRRFHEVLGLAPETRVVLYQGGFSRDRGIEQLIEAIPSVPDAVLVLLGYGNLQAELERRAADRDAGRARPDPARGAAGRAARLGRSRGRRRDADPALDAQPPAHDAQQAVRGDGRGRAGGRERPAGDGRDRARERGRACWSTRPRRRRSRPRCATCSPRMTIARRWARADCRPRTRRTTGSGRWRSCWRSTGA